MSSIGKENQNVIGKIVTLYCILKGVGGSVYQMVMRDTFFQEIRAANAMGKGEGRGEDTAPKARTKTKKIQ